MRISRYLTILATATLAIPGCGGPSDNVSHQAVSGEVTLDGQPLGSGSIVFVPLGGEGAPTGGEIKDGAYSIPTGDGPTPGPHSVSVYSKKATGKSFPDPNNPGEVIEESFETIPSRYNLKTELKAEVVEGRVNIFDFNLTDAIRSPARSNP